MNETLKYGLVAYNATAAPAYNTIGIDNTQKDGMLLLQWYNQLLINIGL
jgi:hypothetical protein